MKFRTFLLIAAATTGAFPALAQDVVVMRRIVAAPADRVMWAPGEWSRPSACGVDMPATRTVSCVSRAVGRPDETLPDSMCAPTGAKPAASETQTDLSGCRASWQAKGWSPWSKTCGKDATRTQVVRCERTDGLVLADSECSGTKPPVSETKDVFDGCTHSWGTDQEGPWSSTCSADAIRSRAVFCARSDGERADPSKCDASTRPGEQEHAAVTTSCTAYWEPNAWGAWSSTCGEGTRNRTLTCRQKDPTTGVMFSGQTPVSACSGIAEPATTESGRSTETCPFRWDLRVEEFTRELGSCENGRIKTLKLYECGYFENGRRTGHGYNESCQQYDPKTIRQGYGSDILEYDCSIDNTNALTLDARTESVSNTMFGRNPSVKLFPGILSNAAALAEARQMCRTVDLRWKNDSTNCLISMQVNPTTNQTRVAVAADSYGMTDKVVMKTEAAGWTMQAQWYLSFSNTKASASGLTVGGAVTPPVGSIKPGVFGCGDIRNLQPYGSMATLLNCTGGK